MWFRIHLYFRTVLLALCGELQDYWDLYGERDLLQHTNEGLQDAIADSRKEIFNLDDQIAQRNGNILRHQKFLDALKEQDLQAATVRYRTALASLKFFSDELMKLCQPKNKRHAEHQLKLLSLQFTLKDLKNVIEKKYKDTGESLEKDDVWEDISESDEEEEAGD